MARPFRDADARRGDEFAKYEMLKLHLDRMEACVDANSDVVFRLSSRVEAIGDSYRLLVTQLGKPNWQVEVTHYTHNPDKRWLINICCAPFGKYYGYQYASQLSSEAVATIVAHTFNSTQYLDLTHLHDELA